MIWFLHTPERFVFLKMAVLGCSSWASRFTKTNPLCLDPILQKLERLRGPNFCSCYQRRNDKLTRIKQGAVFQLWYIICASQYFHFSLIYFIWRKMFLFTRQVSNRKYCEEMELGKKEEMPTQQGKFPSLSSSALGSQVHSIFWHKLIDLFHWKTIQNCFFFADTFYASTMLL